MYTFKDMVILWYVNGTVEICDFDYWPSPEREAVARAILAKTRDRTEIEEGFARRDMYCVIIDKEFDRDAYDFAPNVKETINAIVSKYSLMAALEEESADSSEYSDCKYELDMIEKARKSKAAKMKKEFADTEGEEVIYLKGRAAYYRPGKSTKMYKESEIRRVYGLDKLSMMRLNEKVKKYEALTYLGSEAFPSEWYFETIDRSRIITPCRIEGKKYAIPESIDFLINNLCAGDREAIDHVHTLVLWKLKNLNSPNIPAVIFFGKGWAGKGLFMVLLSSIFGKSNVAENLGRDVLSGSFGFTGEYLAAEFAEISTYNTANDKALGNRLKNIVGARTIEVNRKGVRRYTIPSVTWFIISSNDLKPIRLDHGTGNRRYSVIPVGERIRPAKGSEIATSIRNMRNVVAYVNWLEREYGHRLPGVVPALENAAKEELELRSESEVRSFWTYFNETAKSWDKFSVVRIKDMFKDFCEDNGIDFRAREKYLWNDSPYARKVIAINWKKMKAITVK